jgi:hypothetical protein
MSTTIMLNVEETQCVPHSGGLCPEPNNSSVRKILTSSTSHEAQVTTTTKIGSTILWILWQAVYCTAMLIKMIIMLTLVSILWIILFIPTIEQKLRLLIYHAFPSSATVDKVELETPSKDRKVAKSAKVSFEQIEKVEQKSCVKFSTSVDQAIVAKKACLKSVKTTSVRSVRWAD